MAHELHKQIGSDHTTYLYDQIMTKVSRTVVFVLLLALLVFSLGVKLYYVNKYPVYEDEAISVLAAEGIVQHGVPVLASGYLYSRDLLHHYLLALPIGVLGTSEFSTRILSIFFSLATILGVYLLVSHLSTSWGGVLAAALLVFSKVEMDYALSARMYMQYQMFTVFAVYFFIRGFIEQSRRHQWFCILWVTGMLLSRKLGILVLGVMGVYLLFYSRLKILRDSIVWKSALMILPVLYLLFFYKFPNQMKSTTGFSWQTGGVFTLTDFDYHALTYYITHAFSAVFPWSFPIFLVGLGWTIWKRDRALGFLCLLVILPTLAMSLIERKHMNYVFNLLPIYLSVVCIFLARFWSAVHQKIGMAYRFKDRRSSGEAEASQEKTDFPGWIGLTAGLISVIGYFLIMMLQSQPAYGFKSHRIDEGPAHRFVRERMEPGDVVITSNPWVTYYYLRNFDFFIRQKYYADQGWRAFPVERDEYYGKVIVDTLPELQAIMDNPDFKRIWIVVDGKFFGATGREMIHFVGRNFRWVYGKSQGSPVLVGLYMKQEGP